MGNNISKRLYCIYIIAAVVSFLLCLGGMDPIGHNKPLYLLPLSYAIGLLISRNLRTKFTSLSIIIINTVCIIRYVLLLLVNENHVYGFSNEAIYLMSYEVLAVLIFLNFYSRRISLSKIESNVYNLSRLGVLNRILICMLVPMIMMFPSLLGFFPYLKSSFGHSSPSGIISILFEICLTVAYVFFLASFSRSRKGNPVALGISAFVAIIYMFLLMVGDTNVRRWTFFWVGIPTIYVLMASYSNYKRSILYISAIIIPVGIFFTSFVKFALTEISISEFFRIFITSENLSEYFGGLNGVTRSLSILRTTPEANSFTSTLTDFFGNMPIVSRYFNPDVYSTQLIYLESLERTDLICPLLSQSVIHFGIIGAPVLSIIMAICGVECEVASKKAKTVYSVYAYIELSVIFSLFMCLGTMIILTHVWTLVMLVIVQIINNKYFLDEKVIHNSARI